PLGRRHDRIGRVRQPLVLGGDRLALRGERASTLARGGGESLQAAAALAAQMLDEDAAGPVAIAVALGAGEQIGERLGGAGCRNLAREEIPAPRRPRLDGGDVGGRRIVRLAVRLRGSLLTLAQVRIGGVAGLQAPVESGGRALTLRIQALLLGELATPRIGEGAQRSREPRGILEAVLGRDSMASDAGRGRVAARLLGGLAGGRHVGG